MTTIYKYGNEINDKVLELYGLSTDTKPLDVFENHKILNGSLFYCMDNGAGFLYDAENNKWVAQ